MSSGNDRARSSRSIELLLLACFCLSGASSLTLEVVWVRLLTQVFGSTNLAISTVLAAFMGGLALGSWIGGRIVDRLRRDALWAYAACELGVALSALLIPFIVAGLPSVNAWLWGAFGDTPLVLALLRFVLCGLLLIIPTTFMGATLPILTRALIKSREDFGILGSKVAVLYAINTLGALAGAFAAGFWLLPALGQNNLHHLAVAVAFAVAGFGALLARKRNTRFEPDQAQTGSPAGKTTIDARLALLAFAISGGVSMALQSLFSRALSLVLGSAIQSFTLVLVLFLGGLSLGAAIMGRFASRSSSPLAWLGLGLTGAAAALILVYAWLDGLPAFHHGLVRGTGVELDSAAGIGIRALVAASIAPVTFFLGAIMPLAVSAYARSAETVGRDVGRAYAINTIGAVVGSMAGGFFILPGLGIDGGITFCILCLLAISAVLVSRPQPKKIRLANGSAIAALLLIVLVMPSMNIRSLNEGTFGFLSSDRQQLSAIRSGYKLVYSRDGRASTISVFEWNGTFAMLNNGKSDGSSHEDVHTQILLGLIPAMLYDHDTTRSFVIGYGTGMTVGALTQVDNIGEIDVVEIEEAVYEAADKFFSPFTHSPQDNPRVHRHVGDGRNFLMARDRKYGVIISEPPDIWVAGVSNLFSHEFYQAAEAHLLPGGVFCQWVPLYHLRPSTIRMVYRTLNRTFPYVQVFVLSNGNSIVLATREPLRLRMERLEQHFANDKTRAELLRVDLRWPAQLLSMFAVNADELPAFTGKGKIHTYDNGALEFAAQSDYLFSIRTRDNSDLLARQLKEAFAPYGDLDGLNIDLGSGEKRRVRQLGIANALMRAGKTKQAQIWRERSRAATTD